MYKLQRLNEFGQLLGSKGIYPYGDESDKEQILSFKTLKAANRYAKAYVRRYPQTHCAVFENNNSKTALSIIENHEYQKHRVQLQTKFHELNKDKKCVGLILWWVIALPIFILTYLLLNLGIKWLFSLIIVLTSIALVWFGIDNYQSYQLKKHAKKYELEN